MSKKYQVFVSSTFLDLKEERLDTIRSILDVDNIPSGMEAFHAADIEQFQYIKKIIDECDYYILIIGARYGSIDEDGVSFTEREYDYAVNSKKVVLAFIHGEPDSIPKRNTDSDGLLAQKLSDFRQKVSTGRLVSHWTNREDLRAKVIISLMKAINQQPCVGWIRGDAVASEALLSQINELRIENDQLKKKLHEFTSQTPIEIENLAGLTDTFSVHYSGHNANVMAISSSESLTWANIFRIIGPDLLSPRQSSQIQESLSEHIKNARSLFDYPTILKSDLDTIRFQLELLGLVVFEEIKGANGIFYETAKISDVGRMRLAEMVAARSN